MAKIRGLTAIRQYFGEVEPHARRVSVSELKALSKADREELGALSAEALGMELDTTPLPK